MRQTIIAVVPNALSAARLALAAAFPFVPAPWRLVLVVAAGLSDWLDGAIARRFDARTASGQLLDGLADKLFVVSVLVTLGTAGLLAWWQVAGVLARDLAVAYVAAHMALRRDWDQFRRLVPRLPGKTTTAVQFTLFVVMLLWPDAAATGWIVTGVIACSVIAAIDYLSVYVRGLRELDRAA